MLRGFTPVKQSPVGDLLLRQVVLIAAVIDGVLSANDHERFARAYFGTCHTCCESAPLWKEISDVEVSRTHEELTKMARQTARTSARSMRWFGVEHTKVVPMHSGDLRRDHLNDGHFFERILS